MISNVFMKFGAYSAYLTKSGAGQRDFKVNFMDSNMIPWFLNLHNFMISNVFMKFSEYSAYLTQSGAGQRDVCSKMGIIAEWSINGIKNIKSAVRVHLCLAWKMGQSKDIM